MVIISWDIEKCTWGGCGIRRGAARKHAGRARPGPARQRGRPGAGRGPRVRGQGAVGVGGRREKSRQAHETRCVRACDQRGQVATWANERRLGV